MTASRDELGGSTHWPRPSRKRPLHRMNPTHRLASSTVRTCRFLDVGCGAGVAAEALARLGYNVLGLDAAERQIEAARAHAAGQALPLAYRAGVAEDLLADGACFPVIVALEVIEHVPEPAAFLATLAQLLAPGGRLFLSTLNRTAQSFLAAKVGAEYLLRWLPIGTHDWRKFITPAELAGMLRDAGLRTADISGAGCGPADRRAGRPAATWRSTILWRRSGEFNWCQRNRVLLQPDCGMFARRHCVLMNWVLRVADVDRRRAWVHPSNRRI